MLTKNILMGSAAMAAAIVGAWPAEADNHYISLYGGANLAKDVGRVAGGGGAVHATSTGTLFYSTFLGSGTRTLNFEYTADTAFEMSGAKAETGWVLGAAIGSDFGGRFYGLRGEIELSFRNNSLKPARLHGFASDVGSDVQVFGSSALVTYPVDVHPVNPLLVISQRAIVNTTTTFQATFTSAIDVVSNGSTQTWALLANVWYDFDWDDTFKPYIGGGVGLARTHIQAGGGDLFEGQDNNFAWQVGAGVNLALDGKTALNIGYRHMDAGEVSMDVQTLSGVATFTQKVEHQSLIVGLNFNLE